MKPTLQHLRDKEALDNKDLSDLEDNATQKSKAAALTTALTEAAVAGSNKLECSNHCVKIGMEMRIQTPGLKHLLVFTVVKLGSILASVAMNRAYPVGSIITQVITAGEEPSAVASLGPRTDEQLVSDIESTSEKTKTKGEARKIELPPLPNNPAEITMFESNLKQACRGLATADTKDRLFTFLSKARSLPPETKKLSRIPSDLDFVENLLFQALQRPISKLKDFQEKIDRVKKVRVAELAEKKSNDAPMIARKMLSMFSTHIDLFPGLINHLGVVGLTTIQFANHGNAKMENFLDDRMQAFND